jgi:hypothetical protein
MSDWSRETRWWRISTPRLEELFGSPERRIDRLATRVRSLGCRLVVCDIAPLGLAVARALGVPGVLVENFTWDWIYEGYRTAHVGVADFALIVAGLFSKADLRIQTAPVCVPAEGASSVAPVSRAPRLAAGAPTAPTRPPPSSSTCCERRKPAVSFFAPLRLCVEKTTWSWSR